MGRDKATLPHPNGGTFVRHAIERLRPLCDDICVSGRFSTSIDVTLLEDPVAHQGPIIGILQALAFARKRGMEACLITPVDMPYLSTDDLRRMQLVWATGRQPCCGREIPDGRLQPLVAIYPVSVATSLANHAEKDRSLVNWFADHPAIEIPLSRSACHNVNEPANHYD